MKILFACHVRSWLFHMTDRMNILDVMYHHHQQREASRLPETVETLGGCRTGAVAGCWCRCIAMYLVIPFPRFDRATRLYLALACMCPRAASSFTVREGEGGQGRELHARCRTQGGHAVLTVGKPHGSLRAGRPRPTPTARRPCHGCPLLHGVLCIALQRMHSVVVARTPARRGGAPADSVTVYQCLKLKNSNFLNKGAQNFEHESCRPHYPLQLSQRPYGFFLNRFCKRSLPALNANWCQ
jgi:hypothetical protein